MQNTAREGLQNKTRITDLDPLTMPLTNGCCNDDAIPLDPFCSQLLFPFVQISDACSFGTPSSAVFPTCCNQLDSNLVNLEATGDKFCSFFL